MLSLGTLCVGSTLSVEEMSMLLSALEALRVFCLPGGPSSQRGGDEGLRRGPARGRGLLGPGSGHGGQGTNGAPPLGGGAFLDESPKGSKSKKLKERNRGR